MRQFWRRVVAWCAVSALAVSCQAPAPVAVSPEVARPTMTLGATALVEALSAKPSRNWQDTALTYPPLLERQKAKGFRVQAANGSVAGAFNLNTPSSSVPAYAKPDVWASGPAPQADDYLFVVTDNGMVHKLAPATMTAAIPPRTLGGAYAKTAVLVSGDNERLYLFSSNGTFTVLSTADLSTIWSQRISTSGFTGTTAFIDYSVPQPPNTVFGAHETMYAVSVDGSIYRLDIAAGAVTVHAFPAGSGTDRTAPQANWATNRPIPYGTTVSASNFPLAWRGDVYFGTSTGMFYRVDLSVPASPAVKAWNLAGNTSATGTVRSIVAPAAMDFDDNFDVNALFVPCGDRLNWINPTTGTVVASPSLTLDRDPGPDAGVLSAYTAQTSVVRPYALQDWISIQSLDNPTPTRWGDTALNSVSSTGLVATSARVAPNGEIWCTDNAGSKVSRYTPAGVLIGSTTLQNGANRGPIKLEFAPNGDCWVTAGQIPNGGFIEKLAPNGTRRIPTITTITRALYLDTDTNNNVWISDFANGRIYKLDNNGNTIAGFPKAQAGATTIYNDPNTNCAWVTSYGANGSVVWRVTPTGAVTQHTTAARPIYCAFDPLTGNVWVTNNGANSLSILNPATGAKVQADIALPAAAAMPWAIRFEPDGTPWISCMDYNGANPKVVHRLTRAGAIEASYPMPGRPFEITFDAYGTCWVATDAGLVKILDIGNTADIFSSSYRFTAATGNDSFGYMRFRIPANDFAGYVPTRAELQLTAASTSTDSVQLFTAQPDVGAPLAPWVGYLTAAPNVNYNNRPALLTGLPFSSLTNATFTKDAAPYAFSVPMPGDQLNSAHTTNAQYAYAVRSVGKQLRDVVHWYSPKSAGGTTTRHPVLRVTLDSASAFDTTKPGLVCQPVVDANARRIYVGAGNALFQVSYADATAFASTASTYYNLTQAGRTFGPTTAAPKKYLFATGNALLTPNYRVVVPDYNPNGQLFLNNFNVNGAPTGDRLGYVVDLNPGRGQVAQQMLYDYTGGSAYMVTTAAAPASNYVIRANILQ